MMLLPCNPCRTGLTRWSLDRQRGLARLLYCGSLSVEVADRHSGKVAQPAHRVKDKRLRRAFGILDTARRLGFVMVKGLLPTPVKQGLTLRCLGWRRSIGWQRNFARLLYCCSLSVEDANTEPRGLIIASAPTLIYGGRGMDGIEYIWFRVRIACFRARHTLRRA